MTQLFQFTLHAMLSASLLTAAEPLTVEAPAVGPADSFPLIQPDQLTMVMEQTGRTSIANHAPGNTLAFTRPVERRTLREKISAFLDDPENHPARARVEITWQDEENAPSLFTRTLSGDMTSSVTRLRRGTVTIHRTILASRKHNAVFVHLQADQPGALTFHVALPAPAGAITRIEDRRQLVWENEGSTARLWVFPYESDVEAKDGGLHVPGEGEALLIFFSRAPGQADLPRLPALLAEVHDPGQAHPDPGKIWRGLLASESATTMKP